MGGVGRSWREGQMGVVATGLLDRQMGGVGRGWQEGQMGAVRI